MVRKNGKGGLEIETRQMTIYMEGMGMNLVVVDVEDNVDLKKVVEMSLARH